MRHHFHEHGYVRLEHAFAEHAAELAAAVWAELARRHGIERRDRSTWTLREPRGLGAVRRVTPRLATPRMRAAIDELLGAGWPQPFSWGDPLVTFPEAGEWAPPTRGWHIDFPACATLRLKWLGYLEPVGPDGGGTVIADGSHRLVERALRDLAPDDPGRSPVIRNAIGPLADVVELTGEPGDVVFMHPWLFHAPAPNRSDAPRLMVTGGLAG